MNGLTGPREAEFALICRGREDEPFPLSAGLRLGQVLEDCYRRPLLAQLESADTHFALRKVCPGPKDDACPVAGRRSIDLTQLELDRCLEVADDRLLRPYLD